MRKIEFKAKRIDNGRWVYGYLFENITSARHISYIIEGGFVPGISMPSSNFIEVDTKTVCQYIGLNDKAGKKIYEKDLVEAGGDGVPSVFEIYFKDGGFWYKYKDHSCDIPFSGHQWLENILSRFWVIGNVIDNPELLG